LTDACYDVRSETIISTRRHIRDVTLNFRGRRPAAEADASTVAGPVSFLTYCPHSEHFVMAAGGEASIWRGRDGQPEAVISGLNGIFYPYEGPDGLEIKESTKGDDVPGPPDVGLLRRMADSCREITAVTVAEEAGPPVKDTGEANGVVYFGSEDGVMAVHDTYEGRVDYAMTIFEGERLIFIERLKGRYQGCPRPFVVASDSGKIALVKDPTDSVVDGMGIKTALLLWRCPGAGGLGLSRPPTFDRTMQLLAAAAEHADTVHVWDLKQPSLSRTPEEPVAALQVGAIGARDPRALRIAVPHIGVWGTERC
jgi:hypothetical protein